MRRARARRRSATAAPVEHGGPHVGERAVPVRQQVPRAEPGEHVLHDILGRWAVAEQQDGQADQLGVVRPEHTGHAGTTRRVPGSPAAVQAITSS